MRKDLLLRTGVIAACLLVASGCQQKHPGDETGGPANPSAWAGFASSPGPILVGHPLKPSDLTESERRFGVAPKRGSGIVYQDGIILMEHGDQAIRSFASNGLSWSFDANAPQVSEIQPGKIVFATGRAVGRVLATQRNGDQVSAVLGPVQLTDLVKQGKFAYDQPLDLNSLVAVVAPDYPGAVNSTASQAGAPGAQSSIENSSGVRRVVSYYVVSDTGKWTPMKTIMRPGKPRLLRTDFHPSPRSWPMQAGAIPNPGFNPGNFNPGPLPTPNIPMIPLNGLQATPCVTCGGIGLKLYQEKNGVRVWVSVVFHLNHPRIIFYASIANGGVEANLQLVGGAGVTVTVDAASSQDYKANIAETGIIPADITLPIGGIFLPLEVLLSQSIDLHSAFSAKTSVLHGSGGIDLDGEIAADYHKGGWEITPPHGKVKQNLAGLVTGVSVGINSMEFAINQRLMVGVGALGFASGPYVNLISAITSLKQASIATTLLSQAPLCAQGTFNMSLGAGIGYSMPKVVATVINAVLSLFGVTKPIPPWGSIVALPHRVVLIDQRDEKPDGCSGK
jgi:hypothetical protein